MQGKDDFFGKEYCDRCQSKLDSRTTSWFNTETICLNCSLWEDKIIDAQEKSRRKLEGIGSVPDVDFDIYWGEPPEKQQ